MEWQRSNKQAFSKSVAIAKYGVNYAILSTRVKNLHTYQNEGKCTLQLVGYIKQIIVVFECSVCSYVRLMYTDRGNSIANVDNTFG